MAQIMFETFNVQGLCIQFPTFLSLLGAGKFTGTVLDLGEGITQCNAIFDGYIVPNTLEILDFAGKDLTEYMTTIFKEKGKIFLTQYEKEICQKIKEKVCYTTYYDYEEEIESVDPYEYELPDGTLINIKDLRIKCPEILFKPSLLKKDGNGIAQICYNSIEKCIDERKDLYNCIVLSGGSSMFEGLKDRLSREIQYLAPDSMKDEVKVIAIPERKNLVWIGGSILTSISSFESMWITKTEYEESGATIVHSKCQ